MKKKSTTKKTSKRQTVTKPKELSLADQTHIQKEKHLALWAGVIFFMSLIVIVWIFNFKQTFRNINQSSSDSASGVELQGIISNVGGALSETKDELGTLRDTMKNSDGTESEQITDLRERLELIEQRIQLENFLYNLDQNLQYAKESQ